MKKIQINSIGAVSPGISIMMSLEHKVMSKKDLSRMMRINYVTLEKIIRGDLPITDTIAESLSSVLGGSSRLWLNMEKNYRKILQLQHEKEMREAARKGNQSGYGHVHAHNEIDDDELWEDEG